MKGIGLSLTRELIRLHGGTIEVASEVGKGTVFTVRIPIGKDHLPIEQVSEVPSSAVKFLTDLRSKASSPGGGEVESERMKGKGKKRRSGSQMVDASGQILHSPLSLSLSDGIINVIIGIINMFINCFLIVPPRILLVDDNADMRTYISSLLRKQVGLISFHFFSLSFLFSIK